MHADDTAPTAEASEQHLDSALSRFLEVASDMSGTTLIYFQDNYSKEEVMQVSSHMSLSRRTTNSKI